MLARVFNDVENSSMSSCCSSWIFHGIVHAVFNDPWRCSRQIHVFFMAFLRSMKNLSWLWAKFHFVGGKRKHEPWKFHLRWIKQRHPHKQNFNTSKMISSFSLGCQTVMGVFSQTISFSTPIPIRGIRWELQLHYCTQDKAINHADLSFSFKFYSFHQS